MLNATTIKFWTRKIADELGRANAAQVCEVSDTMISEWCNLEKPRCVIPAHQLFRLDAMHPDHPLLNELARECGYRLEAIEKKPASTYASEMARGEADKAFGDFKYADAEARADGIYTENEKRRTAAKGINAISEIYSVIATCGRVA